MIHIELLPGSWLPYTGCDRPAQRNSSTAARFTSSPPPGRGGPCAGPIRPSANLPVTRPNSRDRESARGSRSVPVPSLGSLALGPALPPVPLVLAALLVGAVGARVALAPSRSDAVGALAATVETWTLLGRG